MNNDSKPTGQHQIALITGASRGLGKSAALHLAARGVDVIFTYREREAEALEVVKEIEARGSKAIALQLDVADSSRFAAFAGQVKDALQRTWQREQFDFLVNNAGVGVYQPFETTTEADFDMLYKLHLKGPYFLTQALLPLIADGGRILNVSTGLARFSLPGFSAYASMKGGVEVMTRYMAKELGARRISVNAIAPGAIETDFGGGAVRDNKAMNEHVASATALGRAGLPDDIGGAISNLLRPENAWMNAQRVEVSGGQNL